MLPLSNMSPWSLRAHKIACTVFKSSEWLHVNGVLPGTQEEERRGIVGYGRRVMKNPTSRRSFITRGMAAAGIATSGARLFADNDEHSGKLPKGDAAILRFLAAA